MRVVGSVHLYSTRRTGPFGQTKDTDDLARLEVSGDNPVEALRALRVLVDVLEQQMTEQEEARKDNPAEKTGEKPRGVQRRRGRPLQDDEEEDEDEEDEV